jgi:ABC-type cobalamin/Fe3+-siderophores transport system ATPase subunit
VPFSLTFEQNTAYPISLDLDEGGVLFVLGANGTGKSSLMQRFYTQTRPLSRRISAHRQTWFTSNTVDLTPSSKRSTEENIANTDTNSYSRYRDDYAAQRASMTIFELIDAQNVRARGIAAAVDSADLDDAVKRSLAEAPLKAINSLLHQSNIPIEIDVVENEQIVARKNGGPPYSIAELSDGERNALLIAGDVLTAKPGALLIIDEPERHLHRSIISPLLTLLFAKRKDCSFIIATHDIDLPLDNEHAQVLLVRSASYVGSYVRAWQADLLDAGDQIDEDIKRDVIGARRRILFVEGREDSLDKPLYSLIFPMVSVVAKDSCKAVEQAVVGLAEAESLSWVKAWGIVDGDSQSAERVEQLAQRSVLASRSTPLSRSTITLGLLSVLLRDRHRSPLPILVRKPVLQLTPA